MRRPSRTIVVLAATFAILATVITFWALQLQWPESLSCPLATDMDHVPDCTHSFTPAGALGFGAVAAAVVTLALSVITVATRWLRRGG